MFKSLLKGALIGTFFLSSVILANLEEDYAQGFLYSQNGEHYKAFTIMLILAKKNHPDAIQNIALSYYNGLGVKKDLVKAKIYFKKAHKLGILDATNELGNIAYRRKNIDKAERLWLIASNKNNEYATYNLAILRLKQRLKQEAYTLLLKAKKLNHPLAQKTLKQYYD